MNSPSGFASRLCAFCDSTSVVMPGAASNLLALAEIMAERQIELIFTGPTSGALALLVDAVGDAGGRATDARSLLEYKRSGNDAVAEADALRELQELKRIIYDISDGFMFISGDFEVLDPLMEHLTWRRRGPMPKPVYLVNFMRQWSDLLDMFDTMASHGFLPEFFEKGYTLVETPQQALDDFCQLNRMGLLAGSSR